MSFRISLSLRSYPTLTGCARLDFLRKWDLPENLEVRCSVREGFLSETWEVPESFARAHFHPNSDTEGECVPIDMLLPGEIGRRPGSTRPDLGIVDTLTVERACALFIAARLRQLKEANVRLAERISELEEAVKDDDDA
jgi:hypothetical protein